MQNFNKTVNDIKEELRDELETHWKLIKRYKKCHRTLRTLEFILNMSSVACHSTALINLVSSLGTLSVILSSAGIVSSGLATFCSQLDKRKVVILTRHEQLLEIARQIDREIVEKYLNDATISQEDFSGILRSIEKYYERKKEIQKRNSRHNFSD